MGSQKKPFLSVLEKENLSELKGLFVAQIYCLADLIHHSNTMIFSRWAVGLAMLKLINCWNSSEQGCFLTGFGGFFFNPQK